MKQLVLSIPGTGGPQRIPVPNQIDELNQNAGHLGENVIQTALILGLIVAIVLCLLYLIWGGIQWIYSGGDKNGVDAARRKIFYAIIGLLITLLAFVTITILGGVFGITP